MTDSIFASPAGDRALRAWYTRMLADMPCRSRMIQTRYGRTHLLQAGDPTGDPVVLLPGLSTNAATWKPQIPALAEAYCVYAVDVVGQPGLSAANRPAALGNGYARWLLDVLDVLAIPKAILIGLSFGGYITLKLGSIMPERIAKAVLLAPAGLSFFSPRVFREIAAASLWAESYEDAMNANTVETLTVPGHTPEAADDAKAVQALFALVHKHSRRSRDPRVLFDQAVPAAPLPRRSLRRFHVPTLVLVGAYDMLFDAGALVRGAHRRLPGLVAAEIVPNAGHALTYDRTSYINDRILRFLQS